MCNKRDLRRGKYSKSRRLKWVFRDTVVPPFLLSAEPGSRSVEVWGRAPCFFAVGEDDAMTSPDPEL